MLDPFIINEKGFYYKLKKSLCTNDKLFSTDKESKKTNERLQQT